MNVYQQPLSSKQLQLTCRSQEVMQDCSLFPARPFIPSLASPPLLLAANLREGRKWELPCESPGGGRQHVHARHLGFPEALVTSQSHVNVRATHSELT